jgi:hypothetical protein
MGASNNTKVTDTKGSIKKTLKDVGQRQEMLTTSGNTEVTPKVFNIVKNVLEDIKNFVVFGILSERHWKTSKGC